jgi:hypothetical protein
MSRRSPHSIVGDFYAAEDISAETMIIARARTGPDGQFALGY